MISYKYATVPVVHLTGGLADTVRDYDDNGGGFVFSEYNEKALRKAIDRATQVFSNSKVWHSLLKKITKYNFSWKKTSMDYIKMYNK